MSRKIFVYCLGLLICLGGLGYANRNALKVGEVLEYRVYVKSVIHGANQTVKVVSKDTYNGREVYHIHSEMGTIGLAKKLFNYAQVEDLVLDSEGLYPWVIKIHTLDGKNDQQEEIRFDYAAKKATHIVIKSDGSQESSELNLPGFVQDALSLQFFLRKEHTVGSINKIYFYNNGSISENLFSVKPASSKVQLECGSYSKYQQIVDEVSKITVLISEGPERLPIIVKSIASFGSIEMKLSKITKATD